MGYLKKSLDPDSLNWQCFTSRIYIYMLCKECYAAWWLGDDKSQASIRRDILQDPQNIPGVATEGLLKNCSIHQT